MCEACGNNGWLHATNDGKHEIQRCDNCKMITSDAAAVTIHLMTCKCNWTHKGQSHPASFNVSECAKRLGKTIGSAIDKELSHPTTGWIPAYVQTAVCDGIAHEFRRIIESIGDCKCCLAKVKKLEAEAHQQRYMV